MSRPSSHATHPRDLVLGALRRTRQPMTAYTLLEKLEKHGIKGPPVVYRALKDLMDKGLVHKIQASSRYIACNCDDSHNHALSVLAICDGCQDVEELHDHAVIHHFEKLRGMNIHLSPSAVIELPVICESCAS